MKERINVLLNAYAVSPTWGSEPGLGWNWISNLAKYCNLHVITEGEWKKEIETALDSHPYKEFIHIYYNPVASNIRTMCWNQGDWRFYYHYRQWQEKALDIAKEIIKTNRIDIIHQLNMIGYREPGSLWKIDNIPFVWGPIGGYGWTTLNYLQGQPIKVKFKAIIKNIINCLQAKFYPLPKSALNKAKCIFAANSDVYKYLKRGLREDVILLNETGCYEKDIPIDVATPATTEYNLLWVGKFDYRKQLELAIRIVALLKKTYPKIKLNVVGDTNNDIYSHVLKLVKDLKIEDNIIWYGKIPNAMVHKLMQKSDLFLFTSIDEGTPHVVLEAVQNNLPIVCFDTCGQGDVVNDSIGMKIKLSNPQKSISDFATAIISLLKDSEKLSILKKNCRQRQRELSWDRKMKCVVAEYEKLLHDRR